MPESGIIAVGVGLYRLLSSTSLSKSFQWADPAWNGWSEEMYAVYTYTVVLRSGSRPGGWSKGWEVVKVTCLICGLWLEDMLGQCMVDRQNEPVGCLENLPLTLARNKTHRTCENLHRCADTPHEAYTSYWTIDAVVRCASSKSESVGVKVTCSGPGPSLGGMLGQCNI